MASLKGTQTEKNILTAFAGESQARNRYDIWAHKAKEDGFILVKQIFKETAKQEAHHAARLFGFLEGGLVGISGDFPAGKIGDTHSNLIEAAAGEHEEWEHMYPTFANVADSEGFSQIATVMRNILKAEQFHEKRYLELAKWIKDDTMFKNPTPTEWRCLHCGCIVTGPNAPKICPACGKPMAYFARNEVIF